MILNRITLSRFTVGVLFHVALPCLITKNDGNWLQNFPPALLRKKLKPIPVLVSSTVWNFLDHEQNHQNILTELKRMLFEMGVGR